MKENLENPEKVNDQSTDACSGIGRARFSAHYWWSLFLSTNIEFVKVLIIHTINTIPNNVLVGDDSA